MADDYISDEDRRRAQQQMWQAFGFSLLAGAQKGREAEAVGRAGMAAIGAREASLANAEQARIRKLQGNRLSAENSLMERQLADQNSIAAARTSYLRPGNPEIPGMGPMPDGSAMPDTPAQAPSMDWRGYRNAIAAIDPAKAAQIEPLVVQQILNGAPRGTPAQLAGMPLNASRGAPGFGAGGSAGEAFGGAPAPREAAADSGGAAMNRGSVGRALAQKAMADAELLRNEGLLTQADAMLAKAQSFLPEAIGAPETMTTPDGRRVKVRLYKDGSYEVMQGVAPDREKPHFANVGNRYLPLDAYTGVPMNAGVPVSMTPGESANVRLGYDRLNHEKGKELANAPKFAPDTTKMIEDAREAATKANTLADLGQQFRALNQHQATGTSIDKAPWLPTFNESKQSMEGITAALVPLNRQTGSGTMSDKDAEMFERAMPGIKKTRQVNDGVVQGLEVRRQVANDRVAFLEQYALARKTTVGADQLWRQYLEANPIFDPESNPINPSVNGDRQSWKEWFGLAQPQNQGQARGASAAPAQRQAAPRPVTIDALEAEMKRRGLGQ